MRKLKLVPKGARFFKTQTITLTGEDARGRSVTETVVLTKRPKLFYWISGIFSRPKYIKEIKITL